MKTKNRKIINPLDLILEKKKKKSQWELSFQFRTSYMFCTVEPELPLAHVPNRW